jgi:hypothetical protein
MLIYTTHGLVPYEQLEVVDQIEMFDNARKITTTWKLAGEMVRTDVHVSILRGLESEAVQGAM